MSVIYIDSVIYCCFSVAKLYLTLCDPMNCSSPGLPVLHYLLEFAQIHVHWVCDALTISSSVAPFFSCPQFFPASGSFPVSWLFASGGQSIGVSASASVLSMNIYMYILFQIPFHYRLWQDFEYHSLCYTVGLCYLPILHIAEYICQLQFSNLSPPCHYPLW